jgi:hypothetical protein
MNIGSPYGLKQTECVELTRVALKDHASPVSRILSIAIRFLVQRCPGIRLLVSYADTNQGHHGGIYQATNWIYAGVSKGQLEVFCHGSWVHLKAAHSQRGTIVGLPTRRVGNKHRYLYPLDDEVRSKVAPLMQPYPKRERSIDNDAAAPTAEGGARPTRSLQSPVAS